MKLVSLIITVALFFSMSVQAKIVIKQPDMTVVLKNSVEKYNSQNKKYLWKAELIGEMVYFKKNKSMFTVKILSIENTKLTALVNHHEVVFDGTLKANVNLEKIRKALSEKEFSLLSIFIETAEAATEFPVAPKDLSDAMKSTVGYFESALSTESTLLTNEICRLNDKEASGEKSFSQEQSVIIDEIRYLREMQNVALLEKIVTQKCLTDMTQRRQEALEENKQKGFACLFDTQVEERDHNTKIISEKLVDYNKSYTYYEYLKRNRDERLQYCMSNNIDLTENNCIKRIESLQKQNCIAAKKDLDLGESTAQTSEAPSDSSR
jgi:hypothetical protein